MTVREHIASWLLRRRPHSIVLGKPSMFKRTEIAFRTIENPLPQHTKPLTRWQVEYYEDNYPVPAGVAWVTHDPSMLEAWDSTAKLEFVFVIDQFRGRGIAKKLLHQCCDRWPDLDLGAGISEAGKSLLTSVCRERGLPPPYELGKCGSADGDPVD